MGFTLGKLRDFRLFPLGHMLGGNGRRLCCKNKTKQNKKMKTSIENKKLKIALKFVSRIAKKHSLEVLNAIHCHSNGAFEMTATNIDTTCRAIVPCETQVEGKAGLPVSFLQTMAENKFYSSRLEVNEGKAIFACGDTSSYCDISKNEEFPEMTFFSIPDDSFKLCTIPAQSFFPALNAIFPHVSKDATRYILNSSFFEFTENALKMTATDGKRIFTQNIIAGTFNGKKSSFIVPTDIIKSILAIPADKKNPSDVEIYLKDERIFVNCGNFQVFGKRIDGNYPNYRAVLPDSRDTIHSLSINRAELAEALEKNCNALDKKNKPQSVFTFESCVLSIRSKNEVSETSASVGILWNKPSFSIAFNPFLILDIVNSFEGCDEIKLELRKEIDPIKVTSENKLGVLMPMKMK